MKADMDDAPEYLRQAKREGGPRGCYRWCEDWSFRVPWLMQLPAEIKRWLNNWLFWLRGPCGGVAELSRRLKA